MAPDETASREVGAAIMQTTLATWGNSKAVRIPSEAVRELGIDAGSRATVRVDLRHSALILTFDSRDVRYARSRRMSMEEFAAGWSGVRVGEESFGADAGGEVVE